MLWSPAVAVAPPSIIGEPGGVEAAAHPARTAPTVTQTSTHRRLPARNTMNPVHQPRTRTRQGQKTRHPTTINAAKRGSKPPPPGGPKVANASPCRPAAVVRQKATDGWPELLRLG